MKTLEYHDAANIFPLDEENLDELADVRQRIDDAIVPEPPLGFSDGGIIQTGVDAALDELRTLSRNSKQYLAQVEQRERQRTLLGWRSILTKSSQASTKTCLCRSPHRLASFAGLRRACVTIAAT